VPSRGTSGISGTRRVHMRVWLSAGNQRSVSVIATRLYVRSRLEFGPPFRFADCPCLDRSRPEFMHPAFPIGLGWNVLPSQRSVSARIYARQLRRIGQPRYAASRRSRCSCQNRAAQRSRCLGWNPCSVSPAQTKPLRFVAAIILCSPSRLPNRLLSISQLELRHVPIGLG